MKVALIRKQYSPFGGAERYMDVLAKHLVDMGHEVHIFANRWSSNRLSDQGALKGLFLHKVSMFKWPPALEALTFAVRTKKIIAQQRFDVVHSLDRTLCQDIYRAGDGCHKEWLIQRAKYESLGKSLLVSVNPLHHVMLWIERRLFDPGITKYVIANSMRGKIDIMKHYRYPEERIYVLYNGVDCKRFNSQAREKQRNEVRTKLGFLESDRVIFFLGSGFERKGLAFALKMISQLNDEKIKLLVSGKDNPRKYKRLAELLGVRRQVSFIGPTREPERLFCAADVFLLPTIYDPCSNACLEAMASGVPVVTTETNGASEWIEEGVDGFVLYDLHDIKLCGRLLKDALQLRIGDRQWEKKLSWENHLDVIGNVYHRISKNHGRSKAVVSPRRVGPMYEPVYEPVHEPALCMKVHEDRVQTGEAGWNAPQ